MDDYDAMAFPEPGHDHQRCKDAALAQAERLCAQREQRLTPIRRRVLELIWSNHAPVGAYLLLQQLSEEGHKAAPPTVYRALDFLLELGLVHRIASLNAFIGCRHPAVHHTPRFFLCEQCGMAAELEDPAINCAIAGDADRLGFQVTRQTVEVSGACAHCRQRSAQ